MKIAVVTDDGKTISAHFGKATHYAVVTIENGTVTGREQRDKPAHGPGHHHQHQPEGMIQLQEGITPGPGTGAGDTHGAMVAPITDCQVLISRGMGRGAYESLRAAGLQPVITTVSDIDEAVRQFTEGKLEDHPERLH
jgi:predicted Fe-Mo cluster-binding NifX family protein